MDHAGVTQRGISPWEPSGRLKWRPGDDIPRPGEVLASRPGADMMGGMLRLWADKLVRISTGMALLLLLAAAEKVCPWLYTPPAEPVAPRADAEAAGPLTTADAEPDPNESDEPSPEPLSLAAFLPDAVPVRRPGALTRAVLAETVGARAGTVACGPLNASRDNGGQPAGLAGPLPPWLERFTLFAVDGTAPVVDHDLTVRDPSLTTTLMKTGPPLV